MSEHYYDRSDIFETSFQKVGFHSFKPESSSLILPTSNFSTYETVSTSGTYGLVQLRSRVRRTGTGTEWQGKNYDMKAPNLYTNTLLLNPQNKRKTP